MAAEISTKVPATIADAVAKMWARKGTNSGSLFDEPEFVALEKACLDAYAPGAEFWFTSSLHEILRSLGSPMVRNLDQGLMLNADEAAQRLHQALTNTSSKVVHLCPLNLSDDLPNVAFGGAKVGRFSAQELQELADGPRLEHVFPADRPDWDRLSEFHWLVVEEAVELQQPPSVRTNPAFHNMQQDFGAIDAHETSFPAAVEKALFMLLLAPWEDWSDTLEVDWRGFRIPWTYTNNDDLCVRPMPPPDAERLSWVPRLYDDQYGELVEVEEPGRYNLSHKISTLPNLINNDGWVELERTRLSPLFCTPIEHFFVRAFHADGIDEFMAHLTAIEAALGVQSDYTRPKGDSRKGKSPTVIMKQRVGNLLNDPVAANEYEDLFDIRSAYVHGRPMEQISSFDRVRARRLARRTVSALVNVAVGAKGTPPTDREAFLISLSAR